MTKRELKLACARMGINFKELAGLMGVSYSAVLKWSMGGNILPSHVNHINLLVADAERHFAEEARN